jgi:nitrite reductase/ring-hydroxylating ferredoxin subunit
VECPGHSYFYDLKTGHRTGVPSEKVTTFPLKVEGDDILADIG